MVFGDCSAHSLPRAMLVLVFICSLLAESLPQHVRSEAEQTRGDSLKYDPEQLLSQILGFNETSSPRHAGYGLAAQPFFPGGPSDPLAAPAQPAEPPPPAKKRRRRRKPRLQSTPNAGYGLQQAPAGDSQLPGMPATNYGYQPGVDPQGYGQFYSTGVPRPPRRRIRAGALSTLSTALGNIATHDDYQCVPRLLCEVASGKDGGGGGGGGSAQAQGSLIPTFINMQPLVTLLAAYNGMSSSPLFVFGRAALLGVTSPGNAAACRYAYPLCPADPDRLLDYLNNHNGGFFRFFNGAPVPQPNPGYVGPLQGLQQFYSHLAGIPLGNPTNLIPHPNQINNRPYGLYQGQHNRPEQNYGQQYGYEPSRIKFKNIDLKNDQAERNQIEDRIQNSPEHKYEFVKNPREQDDHINFAVKTNDYKGNSKWSFPQRGNEITVNNVKVGKPLRFPQYDTTSSTSTTKTADRLAKGFAFPGSQSNRNYVDYYNYPPVIDPNELPLRTGTGDLKFDSSNGEPVYYGLPEVPFGDGEEYYTGEEDGEIIYILRGDGDPNNPEVVKLRPGQRLN